MTDAYIKAGYSSVDAGANSSQLFATNHSVQAYYNELVERKANLSLAAAESLLLSKSEKRQLLAAFARAQLTDLITDDGQIRLDKKSPAARALKEFYRKDRLDRFGNPVTTSSLKLIDPIAAIIEDNKMTGDYAPSKHLVAQKVSFEVSLVDKGRKEDGE